MIILILTTLKIYQIFKNMNVLSLFDGMSCGQIALNKAGIEYDNYFASEIKKHAIECTQFNYPNTIQLGDIRNIKASDLPKIDLLIGGSPCQDFSMQNKNRTGLMGLKSSLFFEYLRLKNECNPKYWLLENVTMLPLHFAVLSNYMETYPFETNGALVSAANRRRSFWTNIGPFYNDLFGFRHCDIPQPKDKNITLQSILTDGYTNENKSGNIRTINGFNITDDIDNNQWHFINRVIKNKFENVVYENLDCDYKKGFRFFNQTELERLHNIPKGYTKMLNVKKAHDLIGDGWTVDIIVHIFNFLK
jgi:site-specific DNA-cytosine methylase